MKERKFDPAVPPARGIVFTRGIDGVCRNVNGQTLEECRDQREDRLNSLAWSAGARTIKPPNP